MRGGQAELSLHAPIERVGRVLRVASMPGVDPIHHGTAITRQGEERADAIHRGEDSKDPAGEPTGSARMKYPGDDLFSQEVAPRVSSALESLTSVFGMGTGGSSPLASPGYIFNCRPAPSPGRHRRMEASNHRGGGAVPPSERDPAAC